MYWNVNINEGLLMQQDFIIRVLWEKIHEKSYYKMLSISLLFHNWYPKDVWNIISSQSIIYFRSQILLRVWSV